jgi:hypothetical protein
MPTFTLQPERNPQPTSRVPNGSRVEHGSEANSIHGLQRTLGNQAVQRMVHGTIQTKLTVSVPGDHDEQEADRVSEQVMRMTGAPLQRACSCGGTCPTCRSPSDESAQLKRTEAAEAGAAAAPPIVHDALRSLGHPLDSSARSFMEPRFGYDFSRVRVHSGAVAERSAQDLNAHAYTVGHDIVFGAGRLSPGTDDGRRLLAHELTHVVQQGEAAPAIQRQPAASDPEREAAIAEAEAAASVTTEQLEEQAEAEMRLKLDDRRKRDKRYGWSLALKDKALIQKKGKITEKHQKEIAVKLRFFEGEGKAAYLSTLSGVLSQFPEEAAEILAGPAPSSEAAGQQTRLACDPAQHLFALDYEGDLERERCMDIMSDPEFKHNLFDSNISGAVGYSVEGTTWENVQYRSFGVMLVNYTNGTSEYFMLDDVGNFYYGNKELVLLQYTYLKRKNGLIYPVYAGQIYTNEVLTPHLLAYKNGLKYQVKDLQSLYTLLQVAGAFAAIIGTYSIVEGFRESLKGFRSSREGTTREPPTRTAAPEPEEENVSAIPEEIFEEAPTEPIGAREDMGEIVGDFRIVGDKELLEDGTFQRNISRLDNLKGKQTDIRPVLNLFRSFVQEANGQGAKRLRIVGQFVSNPNVMRINRFATLVGGTATVTGPTEIEIVIPLR